MYGSGAVSCSCSLLIRGPNLARCQAEAPLIALCRFSKPALKESDFHAVVKTALEIAHSQNAIPMWATATVDAGQQKYTICDGRVPDLKDKRYVPMGPNDRLRHHKLAENVFDPSIKPEWSNVKRRQ